MGDFEDFVDSLRSRGGGYDNRDAHEIFDDWLDSEDYEARKETANNKKYKIAENLLDIHKKIRYLNKLKDTLESQLKTSLEPYKTLVLNDETIELRKVKKLFDRQEVLNYITENFGVPIAYHVDQNCSKPKNTEYKLHVELKDTLEEYDLSFIDGFENSKLNFKCPLKWDDLEETNEDNMKFCNSCEKNVYKVSDGEDIKEKITKNQCVSILEEDIEVLGIPTFIENS